MSLFLRRCLFPAVFTALLLIPLSLQAAPTQPAVQPASVKDTSLSVKDAILLVAFGTSVQSGLPAYTALEADMRKAAPGVPLEWAYTSEIIRKKIAKQGRPVLDVPAAMEKLWRDGARSLRVQSLHVAAGEEFSELERLVTLEIARHPDRFTHVYIGRPLLESAADMDAVTTALLGSLQDRKVSQEARKDGDAVLFMAHGQSHGRADLIWTAAQTDLRRKDARSYLATVEGAQNLEQAMKAMREANITRVWLQPFMVVAGDHANNDLVSNEDDSWASQLRKAGFEPLPHLLGMGEVPGIRAVFVRHALETKDDLAAFARTTQKDHN